MSYSQVVYCSRRTRTEGEQAAADVRAILTVSRAANPRTEVTGAMLVNVDCFAQVLEGPEAAVQGLLARIRTDSRHRDVTVLPGSAVQERMFANWSMGFRPIGEEGEQEREAAAILDRAFDTPDEAAAAAVRELVLRTSERVQIW